MTPSELPAAERYVVWAMFGLAAVVLAVAAVGGLARWGGLGGSSNSESAAVFFGGCGAAAVLTVAGVLRLRRLKRVPASYWSPAALVIAGVGAVTLFLLAVGQDIAARSLHETPAAGGYLFVAAMSFHLLSRVREAIQGQRSAVP